MILKCWMSILGSIKTEDGSFLKVEPYPCPNAMQCSLFFPKAMFKQETTRMTKEGLITDADPLGPDKVLQYLRDRCHHPQKHKIMMHVASLNADGVIIPPNVLRLIDHYASKLEEDKKK